uniref:60S ribosomal protein L18a n=1 Tax=Cryptocaryon irritans TaxID=153251 RepID=R9QVT0_9CILI|nr:60S ribosomal protein L18a [Cryptocaryon irritans]
MGKQIQDKSLQMNIHQYLVTGRRLPSEQDKEPQIYAIRVFAKNEILAKSKFWYQMSLQHKIKRANGEVLAVNEILEKNTRHIKTYGICLRFQSRTGQHNMYKEFRDVSLNGAISQLYMEMSGNHRARHETIQILRTAILKKTDHMRRSKTFKYRNSSIKFPIVKSLPRASEKKFKTIFKANRPNLHKS